MGGEEANVPYWGQDGVHEVYRDWHTLLAEYDGDRALCAEAWLPTPEQTALWVRPDEMHQAFNFAYLETPWDAAALRSVIDRSLEAFGAVGAPSTWVLSNHDVVRHASRLALTAENLQSRTRGLLLMALSNTTGALLLTTGNKSEMATGYATLYGDMCGGYNVLKDVYKTRVYALSRWRNAQALGGRADPIPDRILTKAPTAELRPGQTDQDSLPPYYLLDALL